MRPSDRLKSNNRRFALLVGAAGIEPATLSLSGTRSNQLSYAPYVNRHAALTCLRRSPRLGQSARSKPLRGRVELWRQPGSNRRPQACKACALPTELCPRVRNPILPPLVHTVCLFEKGFTFEAEEVWFAACAGQLPVDSHNDHPH
jgi:hypothetical protein